MTGLRLTAASVLLLGATMLGCSSTEPPDEVRTTTTVDLADVDVDALDPLAAVEVRPIGPAQGATRVEVESSADRGGGRFELTAFIRACADVAEAVFDDQGVHLLVVDPTCDGPTQLVSVSATAPADWVRPPT
jgi:hypothetical protein